MEKLTKEQEIDFIAGRIMDEFRKHYTSLNNDWHKIAASKIHSQWKGYWAEDKGKRIKELENLLLPHQELTQWIEEEISDENDNMIECSHDFLQSLFWKVHKLNH